jgi:hypothetical protein
MGQDNVDFDIADIPSARSGRRFAQVVQPQHQ